MQLVKYSPLSELQNIQQTIDKFFDDDQGLFSSALELPKLDMYEEDGNIVAEVSLPDFKKQDIQVTTDKNVLEITAVHSEEKERKSKRRYYYRETTSNYYRHIPLPANINDKEVTASFKNGTLKITMPKLSTNEQNTIDIK